jgi:hypothetical protein
LPNTRAVSVKIDESRHEAAKDWLEWIIRWKVDEKAFVPVLAQGNMSHRPSSSTHPSKATDASNIYHKSAPALGALAPNVHATEMRHPVEERWALTWHPW